MPGLEQIEVVRPETLAQGLRLLRLGVEAQAPLRPMAGCTDVLVDAHFGKKLPERFLDVTGLQGELGGLHWASTGLTLGSLCTYAQALQDAQFHAQVPMLAQASSLVGATQIQTRGTFAGNVENGSPAADAVPALMALDAAVELQSVDGKRAIALADYYTGYRQTQRRADELITALHLPAAGRPGQWFRKVGTRAYQAITKVGLAGVFEWRDGRLHEPRVVAVSMAATILRCRHLEAALAGRTYAELDAKALKAAQIQDLQPIDDIRSNSRYRAEVFHRLLLQGLRETQAAVA